MKFLNILLLVLILKWSWATVNGPSLVSEEIHISLKNELQKIISTSIANQIPSVNEIVFHKFWTESISDSKVKASFVYSFIDSSEAAEKAAVHFTGYAFLNKSVDSNATTGEAELEYWTLDEIKVHNTLIEYDKGITIKPSDDDEM